MSDTILEREEPETPTPEPEVPETPETPPEQGAEPEQPETPTEEEVEFGGQRYTATQIKEALEAARNKDQWQKSNTLKAQEIARQRKELEEALALQNLLKQDPEKLRKVLAPEPERDFDTELKAHYDKRPTEYGPDYVKWELDRDRLVSQQASSEAFKQAHAQEVQRAAKEHNESLANRAYDQYKGKVNDDEFREMAQWFVQNIQPKNGKFPDNAFDVAYKVLYGDREVESAKLSGAKLASEQMRKAKPAAGDPGQLKPKEKIAPGDEEDDAFEKAVHERHPRLSR